MECQNEEVLRSANSLFVWCLRCRYCCTCRCLNSWTTWERNGEKQPYLPACLTSNIWLKTSSEYSINYTVTSVGIIWNQNLLVWCILWREKYIEHWHCVWYVKLAKVSKTIKSSLFLDVSLTLNEHAFCNSLIFFYKHTINNFIVSLRTWNKIGENCP